LISFISKRKMATFLSSWKNAAEDPN
jgi:hypothetical protein